MIVVARIAWIVLIVAGVASAAFSGSLPLLACAIALLVGPFVGLAASKRALRDVKVQLSSPTVAHKGEPIACQVRVENGSWIPLTRVEVRLAVRNLLTGQADALVVPGAVGPHEAVDAPFELQSDLAGRVECQAERLVAFDPLGLLSCSASCDVARRLSVMPTLRETYLRTLATAVPLSDTTTYSPFVKGQDASELFALREYEPGDDIRRIHWKLTEKTGQIVVREPSLPLDNSVLVFWDKALLGPCADRARTADALAEVLLALCVQLTSAGVEFDIAASDEASGRCFASHITDEGDIYELIGHLMTGALAPAAESGLAQYSREMGTLLCSRLVYAGTCLPPELYDAARTREVLAFTCDGASGLDIDGSVAAIHFGVGQVEDALAEAGAA